MPRAAAPLAPGPALEPEAKLAFVEFLLTSVDVQESDWHQLGKHPHTGNPSH